MEPRGNAQSSRLRLDIMLSWRTLPLLCLDPSFHLSHQFCETDPTSSRPRRNTPMKPHNPSAVSKACQGLHQKFNNFVLREPRRLRYNSTANGKLNQRRTEQCFSMTAKRFGTQHAMRKAHARPFVRNVRAPSTSPFPTGTRAVHVEFLVCFLPAQLTGEDVDSWGGNSMGTSSWLERCAACSSCNEPCGQQVRTYSAWENPMSDLAVQK